MSMLFVPEDEEYDGTDLTSTVEHHNRGEAVNDNEVEQDLPPIEISDKLTKKYYEQQLNQQSQKNQDDESFPVVRDQDQLSIPIYDSKEIYCNLPLHFYQEIAETILSKDGLLILGRGLGCGILVANILYALSTPSVSLEHGNVTQKKKSLVILLNARDEEIVQLSNAMMELRWMNASLKETLGDDEDEWTAPLRVVNGSDLSNTTRRRSVYEEGGVLSISSRILVVDLLSGIIRPSDITGIFIMHSERVKETSNESFIINLYRDKNDWGFVKAISDEPESFTGFTPLATKLKVLRLSNVFLWPRFHVEVSQSLLQSAATRKSNHGLVTEVAVKLSPKMAKIQSAILSCLQACLNELRRHNPSLESEYWDMENIHDYDFVQRVRLSLDSQWHRISWTSKQLVYDLSTLIDLLSSLLQENSLSYYQRVQGILDSNIRSSSTSNLGTTTMSPWLMMDEATTIISYAKERALGKVNIQTKSVDLDTHDESVVGTEVVYNLEELPKWEQLSLIIDDIMHERSLDNSKTEGPVLIMCSRKQTVEQLSRVISESRKKENSVTGKKSFSARRYMVTKLNDYILWKNITSLTKKLNLDFDKKDDSEQGSSLSDDEKLNTSKSFSRGNNLPQSKRRRTRGAAAVANVSRLYSGTTFDRNSGAVDLDEEILMSVENQLKSEFEEVSDSEPAEVVQGKETLFVDNPSEDNSKPEHIERFNQIIIETYDKYTNEFLLQELSPSFIIMYDPDLTFIRRVELFQAMNPHTPARTYFMYYGTSVEEQTHLVRIRKEKLAFTRLIKEKASLGKHFETEKDNWKFQIRKPQVVNTRIAGGANFRTENDEMRIVVDTREFSSSLPNLLYRVGTKVLPCMLTVGDYIITPNICVERKAIPDLISSFKSGRLYQQCEQMFRHYELPTLLIEFDESRSFSFVPFSEYKSPGQKASSTIAAKISNKDIQSKITELLVSFPKLKVIWSSSPYETAQIFLELKASQEEPDVEEALSKGVNASISTKEGPPAFNDDAIDLLQSIPGITHLNYLSVISKVRNIADLVELPKETLMEMIGEENGTKAWNFINREIA